jgi:hypothetical protein
MKYILFLISILFLFSCNNTDHKHSHESSSLGKLAWQVGDKMEMYMLTSGNRTQNINFDEVTYSHDLDVVSEIEVLEKSENGFVVQCQSFNKYMLAGDKAYNKHIIDFQNSYAYLLEVDLYGCLIEIINIDELEDICIESSADFCNMLDEKGIDKEDVEFSLVLTQIPQNTDEIKADFDAQFGVFFNFYSNNADAQDISLSLPDTTYRLTEERTELTHPIVKKYCRFKSSNGQNFIKESIVFNKQTTWLNNYTVFRTRMVEDSTYLSTKTEYIIKPKL